MKKVWKITLAISIPIILLGATAGGLALWAFWPAEWSREAPALDFPVEDITVIHVIQAFGNMPWGDYHNGIDFGCNESVNIIAPCDLRVIGMKTWMYATEPDRWQTSLQMKTTIGYSLEIAFESWALNESFGDLQEEAIAVKVNQKVARGEVLGMLLNYGEGCHIHFMIRYKRNPICPYPLFTSEAKNTFDALFSINNIGGIPCNETALLYF